MQASTQDKLFVLWTSGDRDVALKMALMYTLNAKSRGWWREVCLIVWGPSAQLLVGDAELRNKIAELQHVGVEVVACSACANAYGVAGELAALGIEVKPMGQPLSDILQQGYRVLSV